MEGRYILLFPWLGGWQKRGLAEFGTRDFRKGNHGLATRREGRRRGKLYRGHAGVNSQVVVHGP
jgi:hypothetical protein